jgi:hypothetical protein
MSSRYSQLIYLVIAAVALLPVMLWFSAFAAVIFISVIFSAIAGSLVSLSFMRNKLAGFTLALALTAILSFFAYCTATILIKRAEITLDELNWLLVLFFLFLLYATAATLVVYPLIASLLHRFLAYRFCHQHIPYHPHERTGDSHHHHSGG